MDHYADLWASHRGSPSKFVGRLLAGLNVNPVLEIKGIHIHPNESFIVLNDTAQRGPTLSPMGLWKPNRPLCLSKSSRKRPVHHQEKETCSSEIQKARSLYSCCSSLACVAGANKHHDQKKLGGGKGYFALYLPAHHQESQGRNSSRDMEER